MNPGWIGMTVTDTSHSHSCFVVADNDCLVSADERLNNPWVVGVAVGSLHIQSEVSEAFLSRRVLRFDLGGRYSGILFS